MDDAEANTGSGRDIRDEDWSIRIERTPVTELSVAVVSPAFDLAIAEHCTRVVIASTDSGSGRDIRDEDWSSSVGRSSVTELPVGVLSPTFDSAIA